MARQSKPASSNEKKIFVLDTSVLLYDHNSLNHFQEHDVAIPITVLEEVDRFKKGNDVINFEAREFIRMLDKLSHESLLDEWINLNGAGHGRFKVVMNKKTEPDANQVFGEKKADHDILNAALALATENPDKKVVMVSKDINLRIKAKALNLNSEDYETGKIKNIGDLYTGHDILDKVSLKALAKLYSIGFCPYKDIIKTEPIANQYFVLKSADDSQSALAYYNKETKQIERLQKEASYGITPRNAEQAFAMHAILNSKTLLVSVQGVAGTGKTLLAMAGALAQKSNYRQIYLARPIVPLSNKDIGFLPGDIKSKINPYMEPLWDNLKLIQSQFAETDKDYKKINEMVENDKLHITPLAYIRGRSLSNIFFIIDEAQNLTPHEVKTIISRAGENTKIVFTGDIYQIDTPYLDSHSNGLSMLIEKMQGQDLYAHVTLEKGERSALANLATSVL